MTIRHVLPLVVLTIGCGPEARIHEPQQTKQDSPVSLAAVSEVSEWSEPVNLGAVNSLSNDIAPEISKDRLSLYFASNRPGGLGANDIYVSRRASVDDPWGAPINLGPQINSAVADAGPHLSRDGHWLFFTSARLGGAGGNDLYVSYRKNTHDDLTWEAPVNVGPPVNSALSDLGPSVWGPELYFWRGPPTVQVPGDIYVSRMHGHEFGDPELVGELSSASHDEKPGIRFDGRQILIASDRPGTVGDVDIWIATRQGNGHGWGTPLNMVAINSTAGDRRPSFSPDGETVLFDSDRPGGSGLFDLYVSTRVRE